MVNDTLKRLRNSQDMDIIGKGSLLEDLFEVPNKEYSRKTPLNNKSMPLVMYRYAKNLDKDLVDIHNYLSELETGYLNRHDVDDQAIKNRVIHANGMFAESFENLIQLCKVSNIEAEDIHTYYEKLLVQENLKDAFFTKNNTLQTAFNFARHININESHLTKHSILMGYAQIFNGIDDQNLLGMYRYIIGTTKILSSIMWEIHIRVEKLEEAKEVQHYTVMEIFLLFIQVLDICNFNARSLYLQTKLHITK